MIDITGTIGNSKAAQNLIKILQESGSQKKVLGSLSKWLEKLKALKSLKNHHKFFADLLLIHVKKHISEWKVSETTKSHARNVFVRYYRQFFEWVEKNRM